MSLNLLGAALLVLSDVIGLALVPLSLPGLWVMVGGFLVYAAMTQFRSVGAGLILLVLVLAFAGELVDYWLGFRFAKRYGGSSRSGWGALLGGMVGAGMGIPVPVIGSVIGSFAGAFVGAALFEYTGSYRLTGAFRVGWGAILGRAAAAAAKIGFGLVIAVVGLIAAFRV